MRVYLDTGLLGCRSVIVITIITIITIIIIVVTVAVLSAVISIPMKTDIILWYHKLVISQSEQLGKIKVPLDQYIVSTTQPPRCLDRIVHLSCDDGKYLRLGILT